MQIELTPDTENVLVQINGKKYRTLADSLKGYTSVLSSSEYVPGGARMSEKCGDKFTEILLKKQQQKHI